MHVARKCGSKCAHVEHVPIISMTKHTSRFNIDIEININLDIFSLSGLTII